MATRSTLLVSEREAAALRDLVRAWAGGGLGGGARRRALGPLGGQLVRLRVKSESNDYLTCRTWDGLNEGASDLLVAKAWKLRHAVGNYAGLTTLTTTSAGEVAVGDGADSEDWVVTPSYEVDDEIFARYTTGTGVTVGGEELVLVDANVDGRAWAVKAT